MDRIPVNERDVVIDIDRCVDTTSEVRNPPDQLNDQVVSIRVCGVPISVDECVKGLSSNLKSVGEVTPDSAKNSKKEKRKSASAKRPPKPPRPPRGFSLDAADQKLIKEIAELAMIKRARIERMKALKKMRATKASASASSSGNMIAMLFTLLFFAVIIFQGCHPGVSSSNSSVTSIPGSMELGGATEGTLFSASSAPLTGPATGSPNLMEPIPSSDGKYTAKRAFD